MGAERFLDVAVGVFLLVLTLVVLGAVVVELARGC
jgi:hypothetical protein